MSLISLHLGLTTVKHQISYKNDIFCTLLLIRSLKNTISKYVHMLFFVFDTHNTHTVLNTDFCARLIFLWKVMYSKVRYLWPVWPTAGMTLGLIDVAFYLIPSACIKKVHNIIKWGSACARTRVSPTRSQTTN